MPQVTMPRLSDTMEEGTISQWLKQVGDPVHRGDAIAEIETDKATMELEAYDEGVLEQILVEPGSTVPIGEPIAVIGSGEGAAPPAEGADEVQTAQAGEAKPAAQPEAAEQAPAAAAEQAPERAAQQAPAPETEQAPERAAQQAPAAVAAGEPTAQRGDGQIRTSPLARAIARKAGLDLSTVKGSGPGGRIVRADVEAAVSRLQETRPAAAEGGASAGAAVGPAAAAKPGVEVTPAGRAEPEAAAVPAEPVETAPEKPVVAAPTKPAPAGRPEPGQAVPREADAEEVPLSNIRRVTARRLVQSIQETPHFYLTSVVDADELLAFRATANERLAAVDMKISVNDLIIKACAVALRLHPNVNASWGGDKIVRHRRVNVGMAVAVPDGLVVPVIHDADRMSVGEISQRARELAGKARAGKLTLPEMQGGTFTVSNLGMYGVDHFTAVINPPEAAILAVGAAQPEAVVRDGQVLARNTMKITLSIDHRVLDGATAAKFLKDLHEILEEPLRIVM